MIYHNKIEKYLPVIYSYLKSLPKGKVVSYGEIAKKFGIKNPRHVGWILQQNDQPDEIPCYKVVRADGRLAAGYKFGGMAAQKKRLMAEGVKFAGDKIIQK